MPATTDPANPTDPDASTVQIANAEAETNGHPKAEANSYGFSYSETKANGMKSKCAVWVFFMLLSCTAPLFGDCGVERWPVKTLQDPDELEVSKDAVSATVADLRKVIPPEDLKSLDNAVRLPEEFTEYEVHALLIGFKKENDEDYHLVIADPDDTSLTMIAEIPNPECANEKYSNEFSFARNVVESIHAVSAKYHKLPTPIPVVVYGIFFFDFCHGQTGRAPNCAEIHPLLQIEIENEDLHEDKP